MYDILIKENIERQEILLIENGFLSERIVVEKPQENIEGNIYIGKVQNVIPGLQAAFVNIGDNKNAFIHLKDVLPKVDESLDPALKDDINIKDVIKPGMELLVQVKRTENSKKGAKVSTHISLSGKYVVLMPNANFITVSQKIEDKAECERLKSIIKELLPENMGAIMRTSSENKSTDILKEDVENLCQEWNKIAKKAKSEKNIPCLIYNGNSIIKRIFNDFVDREIRSIVVENRETYSQIKQLAKDIPNVKLSLDSNLDTYYDIQRQIEQIEKRKIWLKCGGFITIDKTEALTAIDVNSGKYIGTKNLEQTVLQVNKEATIEIAKQLKLRDIGGIIIIDYIDMQEKENKEKIENLLKDELKKDRSKTQVMGFTKLNLMEMTRKHIN